jgi:hypothetical protein
MCSCDMVTGIGLDEFGFPTTKYFLFHYDCVLLCLTWRRLIAQSDIQNTRLR